MKGFVNKIIMDNIQPTVVILVILGAQIVQGCDRGQGCCNCRDREECRGFTGVCSSGCEESLPPGHGWGGQWCHIGNLAYSRPVKISNREDIEEANLVVDGHVGRGLSSDHCLSLDDAASGGPPWLSVDLEKHSYIYNVTIYGSTELYENTGTFSVRVGNKSEVTSHVLCGHHNGAMDGRVTITCPPGTMGQYVSVHLPDTGHSDLNLCEVVVMGYQVKECPAGYKPNVACEEECDDYTFGSWCSGTCNCANLVWEVCDRETGACKSGCQRNYTATNCSVPGIDNRQEQSEEKSLSEDRARSVALYVVAGIALFCTIVPIVIAVVFKLYAKAQLKDSFSSRWPDNVEFAHPGDVLTRMQSWGETDTDEAIPMRESIIAKPNDMEPICEVKTVDVSNETYQVT